MPIKQSPISFEKWGFGSAFHLTLRLGIRKNRGKMAHGIIFAD
jgi:hypothetical protein